MTDAPDYELRALRNNIRTQLTSYNLIEPYHDYEQGELERLKSETYRLQRTLEGLIVVLASSKLLDLNDFMNEA